MCVCVCVCVCVLITWLPQYTQLMVALFIQHKTSCFFRPHQLKLSFVYKSVSECGGNLTIPEGSFTSPGYPGNYPNISSECRWLIQVPNRQAVTVYFTEFDIPSSEACTADSVSIFSGSSDMVPPVGRYCGQVSIRISLINIQCI